MSSLFSLVVLRHRHVIPEEFGFLGWGSPAMGASPRSPRWEQVVRRVRVPANRGWLGWLAPIDPNPSPPHALGRWHVSFLPIKECGEIVKEFSQPYNLDWYGGKRTGRVSPGTLGTRVLDVA